MRFYTSLNTWRATPTHTRRSWRAPLLERLEDRVVPSIPDGTLLVATFPSPAGIIGVNPSTGAQFPVSTGGNFSEPSYICEAPDGQLYVSDLTAGPSGMGAVIRVDPNTGQQALLATGGQINGPNAIAFVNGFLYVANEGNGQGTFHTLLEVDPTTGQQLRLVTAGGSGSGFSIPTGMVPVPGSNAVYVSDEQGSGSGPIPPAGMVWQINLNTGVQTSFSSNNPNQGMLFEHPVDLALEPSGNIIVANTGSNPNVAGSVFRINAQTGVQTPVGPGGTSFGPFSGTDSVEVGPDGTIFVGAIAGNVPGHVTTVDPVTGAQNTLSLDDNLRSVEGMRFFHTTAQSVTTTTAVTSSANPSEPGQSVTFTATVTANAPGLGTPTGTVQFVIDGSNFGNPVNLNSSGVAISAAISSLSVSGSPHTVEAVYSGDANFSISTGTLNQSVFAQALTMTCSVTQSLLWPPNNKLVNVGLGITVTPPDASLDVLVYANDNASPADAADIGPGTLQLRSQRQGNDNGRVYLIVATANNSAGTSFDVCAVAVPHDHSPSSIQAAQQQAAAAEAYYRQFQIAPSGFALIAESGGGGGAAPPSARPRTGSNNVLTIEAAGLLFQVGSPGPPLTGNATVRSATPTVPVDQARPSLDRFFASLNKGAARVVGSRSRQDGSGKADSWALLLSPLE